jgi:hypothetical protein
MGVLGTCPFCRKSADAELFPRSESEVSSPFPQGATFPGLEPKTRFQSAQRLNRIMQARDSDPRPTPMADFMGFL